MLAAKLLNEKGASNLPCKIVCWDVAQKSGKAGAHLLVSAHHEILAHVNQSKKAFKCRNEKIKDVIKKKYLNYIVIMMCKN